MRDRAANKARPAPAERSAEERRRAGLPITPPAVGHKRDEPDKAKADEERER